MTVLDLEDAFYFQQTNVDAKTLDSIDFLDLNYSDFYKYYLHTNRPCIIKGIAKKWPCQTLWVEQGKPNVSYLKHKYGDAVVPVANCDEKYFNSQSKVNMTLSEYADYWDKYSRSSTGSMPCLYLKDWHFQRDYPKDEVYNLPLYFASDWLNEYLLRTTAFEDDYRFVYMGPKGSWTPFHSDVFSSFSWSVNVCGKKKWVFYAPGEEKHLCDRFGKLVYSVESTDLENKELYPHQEGLVLPVVLIQEVGDAIFVPSGWHHQVWNLEDTISINHNWVNACNINLMWEDILRRLCEVETEIEDCKDADDWTQTCQLLLHGVYGMDMVDFSNFLFYTAEVRLKALRENMALHTNLSDYSFGENHILHDLFSLCSVLKKILGENLESLKTFNGKIASYIESISHFI